MIRWMFYWFFAITLASLSGTSTRSFAAASESFGIEIEDPDPGIEQVDFYLHTVNIGNMVYTNFGHTAIRVVDRRNYTDLVYNWGMFDFGDPLPFAVDFYKGNLDYKLGAYPMTTAMRIYHSEPRRVWQDKLNLDALEKTRLLRRLKWHLRPENRTYRYQYFFDNCSTRPRDFLDEALGGGLRAQFEKVTSPLTFRDFVIEAYQYSPFMDVLLDFGMNSNLDRFATLWETMFHPLHLRSVLASFPERTLLTEGEVIREHALPPAFPKLAYSFLLLFGGVPLIPLGIWLYMQQDRVRPSALLYRLFGGLASAWLFFGGFFGFLMTFSWIFSGHKDLHHNANQLLFWPTDLLIFGLSFLIFIKGRPLLMKSFWYKFFRGYLVLHILVSVLLPVLRISGFIEQNVNRVSVFLLPPYVVILFLLFRLAVRNRNDSMTTAEAR